jgi:hypothetical protein
MSDVGFYQSTYYCTIYSPEGIGPLCVSVTWLVLEISNENDKWSFMELIFIARRINYPV